MSLTLITKGFSQYKWDQVKFGGSGAVPTIKSHPKVPDLYFIATDVGSPYRWNSITQKWEPMMLFKAFPTEYWGSANQQCGDIAIDPNDVTGNILYATVQNGRGTAPEKPSNMGTVVKSYDRGETWIDLNLPIIVKPNERQYLTDRLLVDPNNSNVVWVTTDRNGTYKSNDAGANWTKVITGVPDENPKLDQEGKIIGYNASTCFLAFDVSKGTIVNNQGQNITKRIYLGSRDGLHISEDGGATFSLMANSPDTTRRITLHKDGTLYMTATDTLYKMVNDVWYDISPVVGKPYAGVAVNPKNSKEIVVTTTNSWNKDAVYRSNDGGNPGSWVKLNSTKDISEAPHLDRGGIEVGNVGYNSFEIIWDQFHDDMVWLVDQSAVYQGINIWGNPVNWKLRANGLEEIVVTGPLSAPPKGINVLLSSFADIVGGAEHASLSETPTRTMAKSALGVNNWGGLNSQDVTFQYSNPNFLARVGSITWDNLDIVNSRAGYSLDGGVTWHRFAISPGMRGRIVIPSGGNRIIWLTQADGWSKIGHVYYTDDFGNSWKLSQGAPAGILPYGDQWYIYPGANYIAADKVDPNLVYIWDRGNFYVSKDAGASFEVSATGLPSAHNNPDNNSSYPVMSNIATTPKKTGDIWLAHGMQTMGGLYHSSDTGKTWTVIPNIKPRWVATGLSDTTDNAYPIVFVTSAGSTIIGINFGLFRSDDLGTTWNTVSERIPGIARNLTADNKGRVFAGIQGNGMWYASPAGGAVVAVNILNSQSDTTTVGQTVQLQAILEPKYPSNSDVVWSTSNQAIATVDQNGLVTTISDGTVTITVTADGGITNSKIITVKPVIYADSIAVDSVLYATLNMNKMLSARVYPELTTDKTLIWTIDDNSIARLDSNGTVFGLKQGTANVIVKTKTGTVAKSVKLIVNTTVLAINAGTEIAGYEFQNKSLGQFIPDGPNGDNNLWKAGAGYAGNPVSKNINITQAVEPAPMRVYQSLRYSGQNITPLRYFFRNLIPNSNYQLRLHFVETNSSIAVGSRKFNVVINNLSDSLIDFDIRAAAGGIDIATVKSLNVTSDANGLVTVFFYPVKGNCIINGLELRLIPLQGITITSAGNTLSINNTDTLKAISIPQNATNKNVFWKSSDTSVATINQNGIITGRKEGSVIFTATSIEGNFETTKEYTVQELSIESITVNPDSALLSVGDSIVITATVNPPNATNNKIIWSSSDSSVVTVDQAGKVKAIKAGKAIITASNITNTHHAYTSIEAVNIIATDLILDPTQENVGVQDTLLIRAKILPSNATNKKIKWESSNPNIATVDSLGILTAIAEGNVNITATVEDISQITKVADIHIVPMGICGLSENNGFESDFVEWSKSQNPSLIVTSKTVVHNGYKSASIIPSTLKGTIAKKTPINVVPGSTLTLTCWYKIESSLDQWGNVQWPWNAGYGIFFNDATNNQVGSNQYTIHDITGVRDGWVQYTLKQVVPQNAKTMGLWISKTGPGTLYIDDNCIKVQVDSITANIKEVVMKLGEKVQINASIWPNNATDKTIIWRSTNPTIATVDSLGTITGNTQGTASIIVTALNEGNTFNATAYKLNNSGGSGILASSNKRLDLYSASSFDLGTPVSDTVNVIVSNEVLPVELVHFNVEKENNGVKLYWSTGFEKNNKEFIVYRSADGKTFKQLLSEKSKNNNGATYEVYDYNPLKGISYYKLSQVDTDGGIKDLSTKSINFSANELSVQLFPNPARDIVNLRIYSPEESIIKIILYNSSGINVLSHSLTIKKGYNNTNLKLTNVSKGIYFVTLVDVKTGNKETIKMMVE